MSETDTSYRTMLHSGVLTISDRSSQGLREDKSGPQLAEMLQRHGLDVVWTEVVPDEEYEIRRVLIQWADEHGADLILTTGGTGLSPRDVTPEATLSVVQRLVPGMAEAMRVCQYGKNPARHDLPGRGRCPRQNLDHKPAG